MYVVLMYMYNVCNYLYTVYSTDMVISIYPYIMISIRTIYGTQHQCKYMFIQHMKLLILLIREHIHDINKSHMIS